MRRLGRGSTLIAWALSIGALSATRPGRSIDARAFQWLNRGRSPRLDRFFASVTELGSLYASAGASAVLAAAGRREEAGRALFAALVAWSAGQALKRAVFRARPYDAEPTPPGFRLLIARPRGTSWPSSHPAVLMAFVTVAGRRLGLPGPVRLGLVGLAVTVGASRVALGVHYPSDVLGGLLLGRATGRLVEGG